MSELLFKNGLVMTFVDEKIIFEQKDIHVKDEIIENIAPNIENVSGEVVDLDGQIVMPGMINMHTHLPMKITQGLAEDVGLDDWLNKCIRPIKPTLTREDIKIATKIAVLEMLKHGITCYNDMYFFVEQIAEAVDSFGARLILSPTAFHSGEITDEFIDYNKGLIEQYKDNDLIDVAVGLHQICHFDKESVTRVLEEFHGLTKYIHMHVSEDTNTYNDSMQSNGKSPMAYLSGFDLKDYRILAAHCVFVDENDIELMKDKAIFPVYNPVSNMKLGVGAAPVLQYQEANIPVTLGTDGSSSNTNLSIFEDMKIGALLQKVAAKDPTVCPVEEMLRMVTVNAAKALDKESEIGSIEIGKKADLVTFRNDTIEMIPRHNITSNLVYSATHALAQNVMVNGKWIIKDEKVLVCDEQKIIDDFMEMTDGLLDRTKK